MDNITKILVGITGVALVATVLVNGTNAAKVIGALGSAYQGSLTAAEKG